MAFERAATVFDDAFCVSDDDVACHYRTTEEVNTALRMLIAEGRAPKRRDE